MNLQFCVNWDELSKESQEASESLQDIFTPQNIIIIILNYNPMKFQSGEQLCSFSEWRYSRAEREQQVLCLRCPCGSKKRSMKGKQKVAAFTKTFHSTVNGMSKPLVLLNFTIVITLHQRAYNYSGFDTLTEQTQAIIFKPLSARTRVTNHKSSMHAKLAP